MDKLLKHICMLTVIFLAASCSAIDENLGSCGYEVAVEYSLIVSSQPPRELTAKMVTPEELRMGDAVRQYYSTFFDPYADSIRVSLCCGENRVIDRSCIYGSCCTKYFYLSRGAYDHEVVADDFAADTTLVVENRNVTEWVYLRHTHGVAAIIFDDVAPEVNAVRVAFPNIEAKPLDNNETSLKCYSAKLLPRGAPWQAEIFATLADGTVTKTTLTISRPIAAGELIIEKGYVDDRGAVCVQADEVGATVEFDWKNGTEYSPDL
jgi:hypothetical protein